MALGDRLPGALIADIEREAACALSIKKNLAPGDGVLGASRRFGEDGQVPPPHFLKIRGPLALDHPGGFIF